MATNWTDMTEALPVLEKRLRQEMTRRGLWGSPSYLGYPYPHWRDPDAFQDLVLDCYFFAVVQRLGSLKAQQEVQKKNIHGLVFRNVANFLIDRQRRRDPQGYRLFRNVKEALQAALAGQRLSAPRLRDGRIRAGTRFGFRPTPTETLASVPQIRETFAAPEEWAAAAPHLVRSGSEALAFLEAGLACLAQAKVSDFLCRDLVEAVKQEVQIYGAYGRPARSAGSAVPLADSQDNLDQFVTGLRGHAGAGQPLERPHDPVDQQDSFDRLVASLALAIRNLDRQKRTRAGVNKVFRKLVQLIRQGAPPEDFVQAKLARSLKMAPTTLNDYVLILRTELRALRLDNSED